MVFIGRAIVGHRAGAELGLWNACSAERACCEVEIFSEESKTGLFLKSLSSPTPAASITFARCPRERCPPKLWEGGIKSDHSEGGTRLLCSNPQVPHNADGSGLFVVISGLWFPEASKTGPTVLHCRRLRPSNARSVLDSPAEHLRQRPPGFTRAPRA